MVKVSDKLPKSLLDNEDFKKELNACVWSDLLEPDEFDIIWNDIMERYGLEDVHWFGSMFEEREFWVPAYFRDFPMGSLLRITSMSESENSFFKNYTKPRANLEISMVCEIVSITVEDNIKMHKNKSANLILEKYFGRRWLKSSLLKAAHGLPSEEIQPFEHLDEKQEVKKKLFFNFYRLVQKSEGNMDHLSLLCAVIEKKKMGEEFYGMAVPDVIDVHPPDVVRTKGSASDRVTKRESAIRKANKPLRRCGKCHEMGRHDSRNCGRFNEKAD
ncbi:uncharacterized protein LOC121745948 [Salvia splendens]|uniref:uncharacterized protein LOC121745948 n=1 Tax=Salvia splendens TaxID=180675 RepID=UPI001C27A032|nr:uncharacterized protein LOC121745948 [Salvia splendens]